MKIEHCANECLNSNSSKRDIATCINEIWVNATRSTKIGMSATCSILQFFLRPFFGIMDNVSA